MDDRHFSQLLDRLGLSWQGYRKVRKGVKKRVSRHMQLLGCHSMTEYLRHLDDSPENRREVERVMTVSISHFFRDRSVWTALEEAIIPDIIARSDDIVRVWSAGCALGQEVYSFNILWTRIAEKRTTVPPLEVWATDIHPGYLKRAMEGVYDKSALKGVPDEIKTAFFRPSEKGPTYAITDPVKENIRWEPYDLIREGTPSEKFRIIFLRNNLLTYYRQEIKEPVFRRVLTCLGDGGFLIIGSHEKLPGEFQNLLPVEGVPYIFRKR